MFICIFAEVLNQININIMRDDQTELNNFNASRLLALESANEELKRNLEAVKLELRILKANDPNYDKPLSELNVKNLKTFEEAVEPIMKWMCENQHPHTTVILTGTSAELVEGLQSHLTNKFIVD